ncbi:MAG: hypothetical protein AAGB48_10460 [Planctomycetota bacterium]
MNAPPRHARDPEVRRLLAAAAFACWKSNEAARGSGDPRTAEDWLAEYDGLDTNRRRDTEDALRAFDADQRLISIVTPVLRAP